MTVILETQRLILREFENQEADIEGLKSFLQDKEVMWAYEHRFSDEEVTDWLNWNLSHYQQYQIGLWAMMLKKNHLIIGDCGLTYQTINGEKFLEIGYHLQKDYWHQGFAIEAAQACKRYAFETLKASNVYSVVRDLNIASMNVAVRNRMTVKKCVIKHYYGIEMPHYLFSVRNPNN